MLRVAKEDDDKEEELDNVDDDEDDDDGDEDDDTQIVEPWYLSPLHVLKSMTNGSLGQHC